MKVARAIGALAAAASLAMAAGCHGQPSSMSPAGPQAANIEWLWWVIFWIAVVVFILVMLFFARAAQRSKVEQPEPAELYENKEGDRHAGYLVGAAIAITVITLFVVLIVSVVTGKKVEGLTSNQPVTIQVIGHQWWWEVRYPNAQADLTVTTANEIHVPVHTPVVILTSSQDVIHSFWVPNIQGKRDLLPGYQSAFWIQVDNPGRYHGQCAEYCGMQHAHMGFELVADSPDQFLEWLAQQRKPAADPQDLETRRGQEVFASHSCVLCHTIRGTQAGSKVGPDLTHVGSRRMIAAASLPNTRGALGGWITDPQRIKPGVRMPPNTLQPDDLQALITYLQSLQ